LGKDSNLVLDSQRRLARSILIGLASSIVLFVLFASGPNLAFSVAQQQTTSPATSPSTSSPGGTASPGSSRIEFINPSGSGHSEELSDKNDGTDDSYHLVAWVDTLPPNPSVEFRYLDPATGSQVTIGNGTQTGIADTFDFKWTIPNDLPEEEQITIYAVLFSGGTEIDRDTESDIFLNQHDPDPANPTDTSEPAAETVEITYPANGGAWGLFTPRDRGTAGVINVTASEGTNFVRVVYTVTSPGQEPLWTQCGIETTEDAADGVRCTLSSRHKGTQVTAVGAIANDSPDPDLFDPSDDRTFDDSGDAHRVQTYEQVPGTVTLDQPSQDNAAPGTCSRVFTATLVDQFGVPIANANMDVHARGPVDEIAFDNGSNTSPNKRPDTAGHSSEVARDCSEDPSTAAGTQGDHEAPTGNDTKHIESATTAGTSDVGRFTFQLYSPQPGNTEFVIWSDLDDDDAFCSTEKSASGSVGWGQAAAGSTLSTELSACPSPTSSPLPGPSTASPSPTGTESPDGRGCTITGTDGSESLEGTEGDDVICAGDGNDVITGGGGNDTIYGDEGDDDIRAGDGRDKIFGGAGKDSIRGNRGNDSVSGNGGDDAIRGSTGNDELVGGNGSDAVRGGDGRDTLTGGGGADDLTGGKDNDDLTGGPNNDVLRGGSGRDDCVGHGGRDLFQGCENKRQ